MDPSLHGLHFDKTLTKINTHTVTNITITNEKNNQRHKKKQ